MNEPWIDPGILGGILGGTIGILGSITGGLAGWFVPKGKAKKTRFRRYYFLDCSVAYPTGHRYNRLSVRSTSRRMVRIRLHRSPWH
jgi:hypothetical protein